MPDVGILGCTQVFPFYRYLRNRERECNVAVGAFEAALRFRPEPLSVFCYTYAALHDARWRERFAANLRKELPRLGIPTERRMFDSAADVGHALINAHLTYEKRYIAKSDLLERVSFREDGEPPTDWRIGRGGMRVRDGVLRVNREWGVRVGEIGYTVEGATPVEIWCRSYKHSKPGGPRNDPNEAFDGMDGLYFQVCRLVAMCKESQLLIGNIPDLSTTWERLWEATE